MKSIIYYKCLKSIRCLLHTKRLKLRKMRVDIRKNVKGDFIVKFIID